MTNKHQRSSRVYVVWDRQRYDSSRGLHSPLYVKDIAMATCLKICTEFTEETVPCGNGNISAS